LDIFLGEFERALAYMISFDAYVVDAIHFAVALAYYGLLRVSDSPHFGDSGSGGSAAEFLFPKNISFGSSGEVREVCFFQFARMVHLYSRQFNKSDPVDSLNYLALIGLYGKPITDSKGPSTHQALSLSAQHQLQKGKEYSRALYTFVRELLLESGISPLLLGQIRADSLREMGLIEKLGPLMHLANTEAFLNHIILPAAQDSDRYGVILLLRKNLKLNRRSRLEDAITLYDYAQKYDIVVGILCRQLAEVLASHRNSADVRLDPLFKTMGSSTSSTRPSDDAASMTEMDKAIYQANELMTVYTKQPSIISTISGEHQSTVILLLQLMRFVQVFDKKEYGQALEVLVNTGLVPTSTDMTVVSRLADDFRKVDTLVAPSLPRLLLMGMTAVSELWKALKDGIRGGAGLGGGASIRQKRMEELKTQGRAIILFAGSLQYRIPADVFAKLNQLDVMMC
jgi:nuclear pore complex protein Nup93